MTTVKEKMLSGEWYDAVGNPELTAELMACRDKIHEFNRLHPRDTATRDILLRSLIGHMGRNVVILSPFFCDYGTQISIGDDTYINFNLTVLDEAPIGDNVWLGGNVTVLPGVSIGEGSVIGAGSVVTRDVPPHAVAAGNPARILRWL